MSITINDEITVTIPNDRFMFDEVYTTNNGQIRRNPDWKNIPIVSYTDLDQNMPRVGGMFLSSAYLMVNHDKNEFTIAPVQEQAAAPKLIGIDTTNNCVASVEEGTTTTPGTPGTRTGANAGAESSGLSAGAIAGIVVGIVAGIAIFGGLAFLMWRKRRSPKLAKPTELDAPYHVGIPLAEKHGFSTVEMPAERYPGELGGAERDYAAELDGSSRPSEVPAYTSEREGLIGRR